MKAQYFLIAIMLGILCISCKDKPKDAVKTDEAKSGSVQLITLDPGHFHAALVQKQMYDEVDLTVHVYAPDGPDVQDHLNRINGFNTREESPTAWIEEIYTGSNFLDKMISDTKGNLVVVSGNNAKKTDYIMESVKAGFNVLADKPMVIDPVKFPLLEQAFLEADKNGVLLYDIMTERHEITTMLQKELALIPELFGELVAGTPEYPAVTKESVHHFFKYVSGNPIKRPVWFFDVSQQGEGMVDVTTHLVDLIQWECFPDEIIEYPQDVEIISSSRWPTLLTPAKFKTVTREEAYPDFLKKDIKDDSILNVFSNGEINYKIKGIHAKVSVTWNYQAPEGTGDTHYSIMRGTKANLIIRQGEEENYKPTLYVENSGDTPKGEFELAILKTVENISKKYDGLSVSKNGDFWLINIPEKYKIGHEAHFGQVTEKYLKYLRVGKLPDWEVPNMLAKYYIITEALKKAETVN
ncbi:putative oxidoreductase C-terminal domain-containing protein [Bacteroidota bacterium]